jgi:hypothetical protein
MGNVIFCTGWDESSTLFWALVEGKWQKRRLPRPSQAFMQAWQTEWMRIREVVTEHFLMDMHGMFFELQPHAWEGSVWGVKPVCQHLRIIPDYCAFRGLLAMGGNQTSPNNRRSAIKAGEASDPFLMTGFDRKVLHVKSDKPAEFEVQIDFLGGGDWVTYETLKTGADGYRYHAFPAGFSAHWVRIVPKTTCTASAEFLYT